MSAQPHDRPAEDVAAAHDVDLAAGLDESTARERLEAHGENEIAAGSGRSLVSILVAQFDSALIWVLVAAAVLSVWAGHAVDAVLIAVIVVANGLFGFAQDYRAERSLEALRELTAPTATVVRDGERRDVTATALVPGDVVVVGSGDVVPADSRVAESSELQVDESALTGESEPVEKDPAPVETDTPVAERTSMVFKGTNVTRGHGRAVVTDTGATTQVGEIATSLATTEETETPLQRKLDVLGRRLGIGVLVLAALVAPLLLVRGTDAVQAALTAVSLAVAAVPEGLPAVVTLTLAFGVRAMADEEALVRRLPAVEALGSVDVICSDKTGTLTEGRMAAERVWVADETVDVGTDAPSDVPDRVSLLFRIGALCNDATADEGDPTERALVRAADRIGIDVEAIRASDPRTDEVPFSSERKWMGTVHDDVGYVKGAPEVVLEHADEVLGADGPRSMTAADAERVRAVLDEMADDALRVLAVASTEEPGELASGLTLVGLVGLRDPPRSGVAESIAASERAGIDVKMITGDNARTASAIGRELGLDGDVLTGAELDDLDDGELDDRVEATAVFARTTPQHKVRILRALQDRGHVVAMTGDGVNDAPALKNADVGVAMGIRGTDVAKQASDVVLLDDNYATIERAIERGRAIFENIWKFVAYLLSANVAEVLLVLLASLYGVLILPAVQLLWINLLTDGLPALALGTDPAGEGLMDRPPRDPAANIVDRQMLGVLGGTATVTTAVMLGLMFLTLGGATETTPYALTMVFTGFVLLEFEKLYVIRWLRDTPTLSNRWLALAVAASLGLQVAVLYTPLADYFGTVPLALGDWLVLGGLLLGCLPLYLAVVVVVDRTTSSVARPVPAEGKA